MSAQTPERPTAASQGQARDDCKRALFLRAGNEKSATTFTNLGTFQKKALMKTVDHEGDFTKEMLKSKARMPEHIPLVCISYASKDLNFESKAQERLGIDPWGICDYLRDQLKWPKDSIFIDSEQFGAYDRAFPSGTYEVDEVKRFVYTDADWEALAPQRNWYGVYMWAQRVAPIALYFVSEKYTNSENCIAELRNGVFSHFADTTCSRRIFFVRLGGSEAWWSKFQEDLREVPLSSQQRERVKFFDVSEYGSWLQSRSGKLVLRSISEHLKSLSDAMRDAFGEGDEKAFLKEAAEMKALVPKDKDLDAKGKPLRNRHHPSDSRRLDLNSVSEDILTDCVPGLGRERAAAIVKRREEKLFESVFEMTAIKGIKSLTLERVLPFVTA